MEYTDYILLNMLKHQLLEVYRTFEEKPELMKDTVVKRGYYSLLSVQDEEEFKQWRKLMDSSGLAFTCVDGIEREDNVLGLLEDYAASANWQTIYEFLEWKDEFTPEEWKKQVESNEETVAFVQKEVSRDYDVHIVIFNINGQWAAIGDDADRLFEIFGWQTSTVSNGKEDVSFMYITEYGYQVLSASDYSIKKLDLGCDYIMSFSFTEDMVSAYQQIIDCIRLLSSERIAVSEFMKDRIRFVSHGRGLETLANASIEIFKDSVTATLETGGHIRIADGNSWRLDNIGLPLLLSIGKNIGKA